MYYEHSDICSMHLIVVFLQILDLEAKVENLEADLAQRGGKKNAKNSENLPNGSATHELTGFRGVVTCVKFHPVLSMVVAAGEDGTVKVWDFVNATCAHTFAEHG